MHSYVSADYFFISCHIALMGSSQRNEVEQKPKALTIPSLGEENRTMQLVRLCKPLAEDFKPESLGSAACERDQEPGRLCFNLHRMNSKASFIFSTIVDQEVVVKPIP